MNPFDLTNVNQTDCPVHDYTIDINETTFSKENIKKTLKNVGSAIGDGVDFLVKGAKKVYASVKNDKKEEKSENREREELSDEFSRPGIEPMAELL